MKHFYLKVKKGKRVTIANYDDEMGVKDMERHAEREENEEMKMK